MSGYTITSIVEYYAEHEGYKCGYCKSPNTNFSHGMWAHALTAQDYQDLIDRGWRRSGKYCYKPTMDLTCCPMYTIRCRVSELKLSKSQKKVMKRVNKYLSEGDMSEPPAGDGRRMSNSGGDANNEGDAREQFVGTSRSHQDIDVKKVVRATSDADMNSLEYQPMQGESSTSMSQENITEQNILTTDHKKVQGPDPSKAPCKKAKLLRRMRKLEKMKEKGVDISSLANNTSNKNKEKQMEELINELPEEFKKKLEIRLVRTTPASPEYQASARQTHELYVKYQMTIHGDSREKCAEPKFKDFLVSSPLLEEYSESGPACGYGSFHQQYWLEDSLIGVGVIDILPKCVSSVYFFYDPLYMPWTLGTYGALREIAFTRHLTTIAPELKYYYMGYYIHSCKKMRYKGNFAPSDLLCPETYKWFSIQDCIPKLDASPYSRLDPDIDSLDENSPTENDLTYVPVLFKGVVMPYKVYKRKYGKKDSTEEVMKYATLVGAKTARSLVLVR